MNTHTSANVREHLKRIARDADFQEFVKHLRAELEDAKAVLVRADTDKFPRLQGRAQGLLEILELVDPRPAKGGVAQPIQ